MIARSLSILVFVFFSCVCYAQSVFEFDYYFDINKTREAYHAFLVRNGDGTGFIRVRFQDTDTQSWVVVDMDMQEHYMGDGNEKDNKKTDSSILVFEGIEPRVIVGPANIEYDPDLFLFELNKATGFYEPLGVLSEDNGKDVDGVITEMRLLNEQDLTKERVSLFFTEKDDFYKNLFEVATVRSLSPQLKASKMFLIVVANTEDVSIGATCKVDKEATEKTFSQIAEFLGIQYVPTIIYGKNFSKVNVDNALNAINPSPSDIVVFYYSGHGFNEQNGRYQFPYLDLRDKEYQIYGGAYTLNMEEIYRRIKLKGARLNLVFSDCCNSDPTQNSPVTSDGATTRSSSIGWNIENCRGLFMNTKPSSILMTAASKGELSAGNSTGGIFTFNFRESLDKSMSPFFTNISWDNLLATAKKQTIQKAQHTLCKQVDNSTRVCVQNPVFIKE